MNLRDTVVAEFERLNTVIKELSTELRIQEEGCAAEMTLRLQAEARVKELEARLEETWGVVEDVAIGPLLVCHLCGKHRPCKCDNPPPQP